MTAGQPLRGFVGQGMSGRRQKSAEMVRVYPPGAGYIFTAPRTGIYEFAGWGCGANQVAGGSSYSAAFSLRRVRLSIGQTVTINVGRGDRIGGNGGAGGSDTPTSVTFPDGSQIVWTDPTGAVGTVIGGDVNISGNSSGVAAATAPSYGNYVGGAPTASGPPVSPGSGGFTAGQSYDSHGLIIVTLVGPNVRVL